MNRLLIAAAALLGSTGMSLAKIPMLNATCARGVEVHADEGGPVYINGKEAKLNTVNQNYYEARHGKLTISISINPDGSPDVSATWRGGGNGVCTVK